jgi:hypothetical protein
VGERHESRRSVTNVAESVGAPAGVADILEQAREQAGSADFGPNDDFLVGLRVLLASLDDIDASPADRSGMAGHYLSQLVTRLRLVEHRSRRPDVASEVLDPPLVVCGLPRTGTTALVDLLAQDPAARAPQQWEVANLFPPPDKEQWAADPRIDALQQMLDAMAESNPLVKFGLHTYGATLPEECNSFTSLDFWSPNLCAGRHLPRYLEWLTESHLPRPYEAHRWVLQHLQAHGPSGRWTLKSPFHLFDLPAFLAAYPGAMLVQTHRDPSAMMASMAGMYATIRGQEPGSDGAVETGREVGALWAAGLRRAMAARRDPAVDARVLDISHRDLASEPLATVRRVYERFDLQLTPDAERAMNAWLDNPAQHISAIRFDLAGFGLDAEFLARSFDDYRERFGDHL